MASVIRKVTSWLSRARALSFFLALQVPRAYSCLNRSNSPGTPRIVLAALRRQPNLAEKSVIASISQTEQRPFKTPQLPALRAVVTALAPERRQGFLLLYFQLVGSPSILGGTRSSSRHRLPPHNADRGSKLALAGTDAAPPLFARHSGSQGQTGRFSLTSGGRCSLCQRHRNSGIGRMRLSSLCSSALGPSKVGAGASPQKAFGCQRQAKRSACPAERQVGILSKATALNTAYSR